MCVLISSTTIFILGRIERDVIKMSSALYVKYLLFLSDLKETWIFMTVFQKNTQISNQQKSVEWEPSCSTRTDVEMERHDEANGRFSQFCKWA